MARVTVTGDEELKVDLRRLSSVINKKTLSAARHWAQKIADLASDYAPRDDGYLDQSIRVFEGDQGRDLSGRFTKRTISVGVDYSAPLGPGYWKYGFDYPLQMHEGVYNLGERSRAKASSLGLGDGSKNKGAAYSMQGRYVGRKYLERAAIHLEEDMFDEMEGIIRREVR